MSALLAFSVLLFKQLFCTKRDPDIFISFCVVVYFNVLGKTAKKNILNMIVLIKDFFSLYDTYLNEKKLRIPQCLIIIQCASVFVA